MIPKPILRSVRVPRNTSQDGILHVCVTLGPRCFLRHVSSSCAQKKIRPLSQPDLLSVRTLNSSSQVHYVPAARTHVLILRYRLSPAHIPDQSRQSAAALWVFMGSRRSVTGIWILSFGQSGTSSRHLVLHSGRPGPLTVTGSKALGTRSRAFRHSQLNFLSS